MLDEAGLARQAALGEDSSHRFLAASADEETLACEMAAFANSAGGLIFWGMEADGGQAGIARGELDRANTLLVRAARSLVPPQAVRSTNLPLGEGRLVIVVEVAQSRRPVRDKGGRYWVKVAAGRVIVSPEEMEALSAETASVSVLRAGEEAAAPVADMPCTAQEGAGQEYTCEAEEKIFSHFDPESSVAMEAREVYRLMKKDITVTIGGLADLIGLSKRTILKRVALLKDLGVLVRKGSSRGGVWILVPEKAVACGLVSEQESQAVDDGAKNR